MSWDSIIAFPLELRRAASVKTIELRPYELLLYLYYKKNKPHFIILQNVDFVNRVLQAGIKKEDNCLPTYPYSITLRQNTYSLIKAINYLDKSIAGLEIVRGAALLLHLLKKTIFKIALYLYFPFYYTTNYNICQYGCGLRRGIFSNKNA